MPYSVLGSPSAISTDLFSKRGMFSVTTKQGCNPPRSHQQFSTFSPPKNHRKTPIFFKTPIKNTTTKKVANTTNH
jgi:hypothetical protein